ncbi:MAG: hypothetical protein ACREDT_04270 [Methylocella sp.]
MNSAHEFITIGDSAAYRRYYVNAIAGIGNVSIKVISPEPQRIDKFHETLADIVRQKKPGRRFIISTPTDSHLFYVKYLSENEEKFFVEKPLVGNMKELAESILHFDEFFKYSFLLQYYILEKALSVTYLISRFPEFEQFLCTEGDKLSLQNHRQTFLFDTFERLGKARNIEINILEGRDRSHSGPELHWTERKENCGMFLELGIHAFSLLRLIAGPEKVNHINKLKLYTDETRKSQLMLKSEKNELSATSAKIAGQMEARNNYEVEYKIHIGKQFPSRECKRDMTVYYESGYIHCNFDKETTAIAPHSGKKLYLSTVIEHKYMGMFKLGLIERSLSDYRLDIPEFQLAALRDIFNIHENARF